MARFSLLEAYKKFDIFGQDVKFNVNGKSTVNTCIGATMSIFVAFLTIAYAWIRIDILLQFGDTRYQETVETREDLDTEFFNQSDTGFNIAFALRPHPQVNETYTQAELESYVNLTATLLLSGG